MGNLRHMNRPISHWVLLFALVAMWGSAFMLTGIAVRGLAPSTLVAVRLLIAAIMLTFIVLLLAHRFPSGRLFWLSCFAISLTGNCIPFWLITFGQQRIDSSVAGILMGMMPITTMVLAHFLVRGERLNATKIVGVMLGIAGLVVLIGPDALLQLRGQGTDFLYQLAVLGGAVFYAINTIVARHRPPTEPLIAAAGTAIAGSLMMAPIGLPTAAAQILTAPLGALIAMFALAAISTAIATVVYLKLVVEAGPSFTSFVHFLIPVWALMMGVVFLGEQPTVTNVAGLILILGGIGVTEWAS